jgi:hypothetical protein
MFTKFESEILTERDCVREPEVNGRTYFNRSERIEVLQCEFDSAASGKE